MDNTKAFVLVRFSKLFIKLFNVGLARIFLRLIITIYTLQFANVRWNNGFSEIFSIQDRGPYYWDFCTVFTVFSYLKNWEEKEQDAGGKMSTFWVLGYSDDNYLLCPSLNGLQEMIKTCEDFVNEHGLKFSTDPIPHKCKMKCIPYLLEERALRPMKLCNNDFPWVNSNKHLRTNLNAHCNGMKKVRRAMYIDKSNELIQE